jgi:hypothetical protein
MATYIPIKEPIGLNAWARFSRRVAVSGVPIDKMYGFALVSKKDKPQARIKYAIKNG